ncbi:hypothetical protein O7632_02100 [Solwaraspora sp. WMMD406]|uniref:hypothetical protein n=1 Tax=Solwaraspora sp. WMMD406 TaxID=3016095 RepID=UPI00241634C7|nr:hypothetical protein [Solwaraspora sp. WMMD406]MDG4762912.1 hypothetical protein [Solwaraspora sp. WMMD406]
MRGRTELAGLLVAAVAVVAVLTTGCSIGDIRRPPPERPSPPTEVAPIEVPIAVEVRPMRVPAPAYYDPPLIEFDNARLGYALFPGCTRSLDAGDPVPCPPLLFVTFDAGESWEQRELPAPGEGSPSMQAGYGSLVLSTDAAWYRSLDGGVSFTRSTTGPEGSMPPEFASVDGPYQVCCQTDPVARVVEVTEQGMVPLAPQPPIPVVQTVGHIGDKVTAAGMHEGRLHVAFGAVGVAVRLAPDGSVESQVSGWQWQTSVITIAEPERIRRYVVRTAPSGERWLIGERVPGEPPVLWRVNGVQLELVTVADLPADVISVLPIDGGRLLATTPGGTGVIKNGRYEPVDWPVRDAYLTRSWDGTVQAARADGAVLLSPEQPTRDGWVEVSWQPS